MFYYEDICYIRDTADAVFIEDLKDRNDWNKPLNFEKMSARPIDISLDLVLQTDSKVDATKTKALFSQMAGIEEREIYEMCLLDVNGAGQALYVVLTNENDSTVRYLIFSDGDACIRWVALNEESSCEEQMTGFKRQNEWVYTQGNG